MKFCELIGQTLVKIEGAEIESDEIIFRTLNDTYKLFHYQDCCENVRVIDIIGDISDLLDSPITMAEEVISDTTPKDIDTSTLYLDSFTWTFYKLATIKGYVTIRWLGNSNGYYSESVDFLKVR